MANVGAGEVLKAYLVTTDLITAVDTQYKSSTPVEEIKKIYHLREFKYRYLTSSEMTFQPLTDSLKGRYDRTLFTSEIDIVFRERNKILFEDGRYLMINRVLPQVQHGMFLINKKPPHILELS